MKRINEHADFLSLMEKKGRKPKERKRLLDLADRGDIEACCEVYLNAIRGNINITPKLARSLKQHQKDCRKLLNRNIGLTQKKKILAGQTGGFLPLLLGSLAPMALSVVKGMFTG